GDSSNIGGVVGSSNSGSFFMDGTSSYGTISGNGSASNIGGLIGIAYNTRPSDSYSHMIINTPNANKVGGLVGYYRDFNVIKNSYFAGSVTGADSVGGLVGHLEGGISNWIEHSYSRGTVAGSANVGGLIGLDGQSGAKITASFYDKTIATGMHDEAQVWAKTTAEMKSSATYTGWNATVWQYQDPGEFVEGYGVGNIYPFLKAVTPSDEIVGDITILFAGGWGGTSNGDGSAYTIANASQLQNINQVADKGFNFELSNNIDLSSITNWTPIGNSTTNFVGNLYGNNKTISNLTINTTSNLQGLFGIVGNNATISNLTLSDVDIRAGSLVGGLAGSVFGANTVIDNVSVSGTVVSDNNTNSATQAGGLVGSNASTIRNSTSSVNVTGSTQVGGLVGFNTSSNAKIETSYATGTVTANGASISFPVAGGLVGKNQLGTIENSYATSSVNVTTIENSTAGGLVGETAMGSITNSYAIGSVNATTKGGLIGANTDGALTTVTNSFYDKTLNAGLNDEASYGKTTAQMRTLATFAGWDIQADSTLTGDFPYPRLTMSDSGPVWKIKTAVTGTGGGDTGGSGDTSNIVNAISDVQVQTTQASTTTTGTVTSGTEPVLSSTDTGSSLGSGMTATTSGSLTLVYVDEGAASGDGGGEGDTSGMIELGQGGLDESGFMRVFVVGGGIKLPAEASDTAREQVEGDEGGLEDGSDENAQRRRRPS
ncbi:beta strand repeat-containing protein, partial [Methylophaga lonarensis]|uniref:beta strand repeat-containing protein n=1 Tax=Methylophaga lonarensis TaxID=999151 RepID=UPI003D281BDF